MANTLLFCFFFLTVLHVVLAGGPNRGEPYLGSFIRTVRSNPDSKVYVLPLPLVPKTPCLFPRQWSVDSHLNSLYRESSHSFDSTQTPPDWIKPRIEDCQIVALPKMTFTAPSPKTFTAPPPEIFFTFIPPELPARERWKSFSSVIPSPKRSAGSSGVSSHPLRTAPAPKKLTKAAGPHHVLSPSSPTPKFPHLRTAGEVVTKWGKFERHYNIIRETLPRSRLSTEMSYYHTAEAFHELCSKMKNENFTREFGSISLIRHKDIGVRLRDFIELKLQEWGTKGWAPRAEGSGNEEWLKYLSENPRKPKVQST